ncbi:uncharacterized protein BJX67DRAFT_347534 [Aspergillus lucknowensis]|uniref:Uncharacterized protein n=1 Tax=Aspergillus lucknowensis TaxID=176173 RepID=A0ABR4LYI1_9EURO
MASMPADEYRSRHRLTERLNIEYLGPLEPETWPVHWPETRRHLFHDIVKLGDSKFGTFEGRHSTGRPWRAQIKRRAAKLAYLADRCRGEGKNEPSWRASLEHEVFYRFTVEVSCPTCRARLWRSEIEAAVESSDSQALSLDERRKHRTPCRCSEGFVQSTDFHGVNMIFSDRAETSIHYDPPLPIRSRSRDNQKYERPDRVFGLIETQNIKILLDSPDQRMAPDSQVESLRDVLEASPFKGDRKPLLFPFLIVEAKSDTVGDSAGVEMQSAFAIQRLLVVQDELRAATRVESMWATGPLVWFFGWHGQDWYLKGSFIDHVSGPSPRYCILDLWQGNIRSQSSALQLLLIVDYIFDWARDAYRPSIIRGLSLLAARELPSFDPDIFSTVDRRQSQIASEMAGFSWSQESSSLRFSAALPEPEPEDTHTPSGVVRDASNFETRLLGLQITEANVDELWGSLLAHWGESEPTIVGTLRESLDSSWRVTRRTLSSIQAAWTGNLDTTENVTGSDTGIASDEIFFTAISILFYMTDDWSLVRQLTYLAISEGALQVLLSRYNLPGGQPQDFEETQTPVIDRSSIEPFIKSIRTQSIASHLKAATSTLCISSSHSQRPGRITGKWRLRKTKSTYAGFVFDHAPSTLELVAAFYGTREKMDRDHMDLWDSCLVFSQTATWLPTHSTEPCLWPRLDSICQNSHGCALFEGLNLDGRASGTGARFCLFILSRYDFYRYDIDTAAIVRDLSEGGLYYSALHLDLGRRLRECYGHLNRSTKGQSLWQNADSQELLKEWIEDLDAQPRWTGGPGPGGRPDSPIMISSSEESEGDLMEED